MQQKTSTEPHQSHRAQRWPGGVVWLLGWLVLVGVDRHLDLANQALMLVLLSALSAVWLGPLASLLACAVSVLAFNFLFVPPRGTFTVDLHQHLVLLLTMLLVGWLVTLLMARQRRLADNERLQTERVQQLRQLGERLRESDDEQALAGELRSALQTVTGQPAVVWLALGDDEPAAGRDRLAGEVSDEEMSGLRLCTTQSQGMGPQTGRHEEQPAWYLPLRGRQGSMGAALLRLNTPPPPAPDVLPHVQALCDQLGVALERLQALKNAAQAREAMQNQTLRSTLLAAIAHDHRTPLATILGAASALHDQADRLTPGQSRQLAATIVDEAQQLARLTDNTLQLARLDAPGVDLHLEWESVEELVGTVVRRARQRWVQLTLQVSITPGLPLLKCDAVLLVQLLDNLVDNALKYSAADSPVHLTASGGEEGVLVRVKDRGLGVPPEWRERIFDVFQRGATPVQDAGSARRGAGVGLAVCRAIARVHGGELRYRARRHGGSVFELWLPVLPVPADAMAHEGEGA